MLDRFSRTRLLLGGDALDKLKSVRVAVFGIGGVGSYTAEALVRSGVGNIDIIDDDRVCLTNINRQLFATSSTVGEYKVDVAEKRLLEINPDVKVTKHRVFVLPETVGDFDLTKYDYIVDAVDTVKAKLALAEAATKCSTPIISSMGAGNKLDPTAFTVSDIFKTSVCPLAKVIRTELKKRGIKKLKVVYSKEKPLRPIDSEEGCKGGCICPPTAKRTCTVRRQIPGSVAFVPPVVGLIIAGEVIKDITGVKGNGICG